MLKGKCNMRLSSGFFLICTIMIVSLISSGCSERLNTEECNNLGESTYSESNCLVRVARTNKDKSICENIKDKTGCMKDVCYAAVAFDKKSKSICKSLEGECRTEEECIEMIESSKDIESCRSDPLCISSYIQLNKDEKFCDTLDSQSLAADCLEIVARFRRDTNICEKIDQNDVQRRCYLNIAIETADVNLCDKTGDDKANCISRVALATLDESYCNLLEPESEDKLVCIGAIEHSK